MVFILKIFFGKINNRFRRENLLESIYCFKELGGNSLFEYLENKQKFVIQLGQYISHEIISHDTYRNYNDLDRLYLAYSFLEWKPYPHYFYGSIPREDLVWDIALYIDKRIPQSYIKWRDKLHDSKPNKVVANRYTTGLIYHFKENRNLSSLADLANEELIKIYEDLDLYYEQIYGSKYYLTPYSIREGGISRILRYFTDEIGQLEDIKN